MLEHVLQVLGIPKMLHKYADIPIISFGKSKDTSETFSIPFWESLKVQQSVQKRYTGTFFKFLEYSVGYLECLRLDQKILQINLK